MRIATILLASTLALASPAAIYAAAPTATYLGRSSSFNVEKSTQIPGGVLKPGLYTIRVLDQLSDRMIIRVDSSTNSKDYAIFLGVPRPTLSLASAGPVIWQTGVGGGQALRGFGFGESSAVEFVYPKAEAVTLAKANTARVVAVDPESEGRPKLKNMSQDDLQVVNLWMLSLTTTGADSKTPAILAQRYQNDEKPSSTLSARTSSAAAAAPPVNQVASMAEPQTTSAVRPEGLSAGAPKRQRVLAQLPHTASFLPLIWMAGLLSFVVGLTSRILRRRQEL